MSGGEGGDLGTQTADPLIGRTLSERYHIERKLGEGGMGSVYLAEHVLIQKKVALKVLAPELARKEELAARFLQEARAASRIGHENVIDISDFGRSDGLVYFVMEYLEGQDLGALLRRVGPVPWPRVRGIVLQIARALRAAHSHGIIHRDLKPENVFLVEREGRPDFVKLLDFGIAKVTGPGGDGALDGPRLTRTGMIFGTPEYMAPEQAEGKPADHRADIYSVGCLLYHCLTGRAPFDADSFMAMLTKHLVEAPVPPTVRRPDLDIPLEVDALVMQALEKDRELRFASAEDLIGALASTPGAEASHVVILSRPGISAGIPSRPTKPLGATPAVSTNATELFPPPETLPPTPARTRFGAGRVSRLTLAGVALGLAAGIAFLLLRRSPAPDPAPSATVPVVPAPAPSTVPAPPAAPPVAPAVVAPPAAPEAEKPTAAVKLPSNGERRRRDSRRAPADPTPAAAAPAAVEAPPATPTPSELKPFPK